LWVKYVAGNEGTSQDLLEKIFQAVEDLKGREGRRIVIVDGVGYPAVGSICGISNASVAKYLNSPVLLVGKSGVGDAVDSFNLNSTFFAYHSVPVLGGVFNKFQRDGYYSLERCSRAIGDYFGQYRREISMYGFIPTITPPPPPIPSVDENSNSSSSQLHSSSNMVPETNSEEEEEETKSTISSPPPIPTTQASKSRSQKKKILPTSQSHSFPLSIFLDEFKKIFDVNQLLVDLYNLQLSQRYSMDNPELRHLIDGTNQTQQPDQPLRVSNQSTSNNSNLKKNIKKKRRRMTNGPTNSSKPSKRSRKEVEEEALALGGCSTGS